jgi:hypothetical protein
MSNAPKFIYNGAPLPRTGSPLPCPFCGDPLNDADVEPLQYPGYFPVTAPCCNAQGPQAKTPLDAAREWNSRRSVTAWRKLYAMERKAGSC